MTSDWTPVEMAEAILLLAGVAWLVVGAVHVTLNRRWAGLVRLPVPSISPIQPIDPAIALIVMWLLPQLVFAAIGLGATTEASSEESIATVDPSLPSASLILADGVGKLGAAVVLLLMGATRYRGSLRAWGLDASRCFRRLGQAVVAYIAIWPICFGLLHLTVYLMRLADPEFAPPEHQTIRTLLSGEHAGPLVVVIAVNAVILAPFVEELFFRGMLQPVLAAASRGPWTAVLLSAGAFGLFHYPLVHTMPALAAFGLLLGYLYARTGSLTLVVLVHAIFNGKTLIWLALSAAE